MRFWIGVHGLKDPVFSPADYQPQHTRPSGVFSPDCQVSMCVTRVLSSAARERVAGRGFFPGSVLELLCLVKSTGLSGECPPDRPVSG